MVAKMSMPIDTVFGNTVTIELQSELDNPHELSNRILFADMARMLRGMLHAVREEAEKALDEGERERLLSAADREKGEAHEVATPG